jgi:hypothetical protein
MKIGDFFQCFSLKISKTIFAYSKKLIIKRVFHISSEINIKIVDFFNNQE